MAAIKSEGRLSKPWRAALCLMLAILFSAPAYFLVKYTVAKLYYLNAHNQAIVGRYQAARLELLRADRIWPDDQKIQKKLGQVLIKRAILAKTPKDAWRYNLMARTYFKKAAAANPLDAEAVYGLGQSEERLQGLFAGRFPNRRKNPHDPRPHYRQAVELRPHGISYNYALLSHYYIKGLTQAHLALVGSLVHTYPPVYARLAKEKFWSPDAQETAQKGLQQAIADGICVEQAHRILAGIMTRKKKWHAAIEQRHNILALNPRKNTADDYFSLGRLYLKTGQTQLADASFMQGLAISSRFDASLATVYGLYRKEPYRNFLQFHQQVQERFSLSPAARITLAKTFRALNRNQKARQILEALNRQDPTAEACYLLSEMAGKAKDWDRMESALQKACSLAPENLHYRRSFYQILKKRGKNDSAARELDALIRLDSRNKADWLARRAQRLWQSRAYADALRDWENVLTLKPKDARLHARVAEAYIKIGNLGQARAHYQAATRLAPKNNRYKKRLVKLGTNG
jgi:tetratricopeptide (TPR) repeat protein